MVTFFPAAGAAVEGVVACAPAVGAAEEAAGAPAVAAGAGVAGLPAGGAVGAEFWAAAGSANRSTAAQAIPFHLIHVSPRRISAAHPS